MSFITIHRLAGNTVKSSDLRNRRDVGSCHILSTSAISSAHARLIASKSESNDIQLCKYRKGFFDHLKPRAIVTSTLRVATQQGTLIMANFMTDQLEGDMSRSRRVQNGEITQREANKESDEWEKVEWSKRWNMFPSRFCNALAKYHAITLVLRAYEKIAAKFNDEVVMDKLTMDPFHAGVDVASKNSGDNKAIAKEMFQTTFWANILAFMADYSVHQIILCYGYYVYIKRRERKDDEEGMNGAIFTSAMKKSTHLMISRSFGLVCSAIGGAIGTVIWPGWGTLLCANMGEGAAGVVLEETQLPATI